jgi:lipoprotein-anchoring transpeptidase ErfK/SrfK
MRMRSAFHRFYLGAAFAMLLMAFPAAARAEVVARISLSAQEMVVYIDGMPRYDWPVSTARPGYRTPKGSWRPTRMHRMWYSKKYDNAPMPSAIFFLGGYAVHGTPHIRSLGRPASHGCVRLHPDNARMLFQIVAANGMQNTRIEITQ